MNDVPAITGACGQDFLLPPPPLRYFLVGGGGKSPVHKSCPQAPVVDSGYIKPIISSMLKSVEFLTPHTGLLLFYNYICIVIYFPAM